MREQPVDRRKPGERVEGETLVGLGIGDLHSQVVVRLSEHAAHLDHLGHGGGGGFEILDGLAIVHRDVDRHHHLESASGSFRIDLGVVALDDAVPFQALHAAQARGRGQADPTRQFGVAESSISLQLGNNCVIEVIDAMIIAHLSRVSGRFGNPVNVEIPYHCSMSSRSPQTRRPEAAPEREAIEPARRDEIVAGARTVLPAGLAVIPLGLALGVLVVQSGFEWWWATMLAAIVFAGSLEFFLVGLFAAAAPLAQIAVSAVIVNFRHVFYALSFPLHRVTGRGWKAYSTFALTDEAYALTATPAAHGWTRARILTIQAGFHFLWVLFVTIGAGLGTMIPPQVVGLDFALTALFVVLGVEAYKVRKSLPAPALAFGCAIVGLLVSPENMLMIAMGLFVLALGCGYALTKRTRRVG